MGWAVTGEADGGREAQAGDQRAGGGLPGQVRMALSLSQGSPRPGVIPGWEAAEGPPPWSPGDLSLPPPQQA